MSTPLTLGIETSCDDTSVALVTDEGLVIDQKRWTCDQDHVIFGGIVPERASRNHLKTLMPLISAILKENHLEVKDLRGLAVTNRPGLQGSLIVGLVTAKTLSLIHQVPLVGVNHLEGHLYSPWLYDKGEKPFEIPYPHLSLIVSGGHTQLVLVKQLGDYQILGKTYDDAAGEAIDKFSNCIGLGFPGGVQVDQKSQSGDPQAYDFPRPLLRRAGYDFSFSGLKAAGFRLVEEMTQKKPLDEQEKADLSASYLESVTEVLVNKTKKAIEAFKPKAFCVVGGVSANSVLRAKMKDLSDQEGLPFYKSKLTYCTDNGAMIAYAGSLRFQKGLVQEGQNLTTHARSTEGDFYE